MDPVRKLSRSVTRLVGAGYRRSERHGTPPPPAHAFADEGAKVAVTDFDAEGAAAVAN